MPLRKPNAALYMSPRPSPLPYIYQDYYSHYPKSPYPPSRTSTTPTLYPSSTSATSTTPTLFPSSISATSTSAPRWLLPRFFCRFRTMGVRFGRSKRSRSSSPTRKRNKAQKGVGNRVISGPSDPVRVQRLEPRDPMIHLTSGSSVGQELTLNDFLKGASMESTRTSPTAAGRRQESLASHPPTREPPPIPTTNINFGEAQSPEKPRVIIPPAARNETPSAFRQKPGHALVGDEYPESRYLTQRIWQTLEGHPSSDPSSSSDASPVADERQGPVPVDHAGNTSLIRVSAQDPGWDLYQTYRKSKARDMCYTISAAALDSENRYTWQHCWGLIDAYIIGTTLKDYVFADRVMDILTKELKPGECADDETIKLIFSEKGISQQLKRFVVDRCIDAGAKYLRPADTERLPPAFARFALHRAVERLSSDDLAPSSDSSGCKYHIHRKPWRCYKLTQEQRGEMKANWQDEEANRRGYGFNVLAREERDIKCGAQEHDGIDCQDWVQRRHDVAQAPGEERIERNMNHHSAGRQKMREVPKRDRPLLIGINDDLDRWHKRIENEFSGDSLQNPGICAANYTTKSNITPARNVVESAISKQVRTERLFPLSPKCNNGKTVGRKSLAENGIPRSALGSLAEEPESPHSRPKIFPQATPKTPSTLARPQTQTRNAEFLTRIPGAYPESQIGV